MKEEFSESTFMSSTDEKSGQRFIPEAPNLNPFKGFQCVLDHGINKVHSDALLIWKAISTIQSSIAYRVIRGQGISVSSIIVYCQIWGQEISLPLYYDAKEKDKKD